MKLPCEEALWYVLPQIRADLAKELIKNGSSQKEAAGLLGLTPSAVSQYTHKKRAGRVKTSAPYKEFLKKVAKEIKQAKGEEKVSRLICKCCVKYRSM